MPDAFQTFTDSPSAPALRATPVTPDDAAPLGSVPKALYVGKGGDLTMRGVGDIADSVWRNVPDGAILPFRPSHVRASGTTAANILALG